MSSDQRNLLEALEIKAAQIERDNLTGLLELDQQTQSLLGQLDQADLHLAALQARNATCQSALTSLCDGFFGGPQCSPSWPRPTVSNWPK